MDGTRRAIAMEKGIITVLIVAAAAAFVLTGCTGPEGGVYTSFDWTSQPDYLAISDLTIPSVVYPGAYYATTQGTYYLEYSHPSYSLYFVRYISYTVKGHPGEPGMVQGADAFFTIWLLENTDPVLIQDFSQASSARGAAAAPERSVRQVDPGSTPAVTPGTRVKQFTYTRSAGGYEMEVECGIIRRGQ
jgi:hypothetical protein